MPTDSYLTALISQNVCLDALNRKNGLNLTYSDLFALYIIRAFNQSGNKCGYTHVDAFFKANGRRKSHTEFTMSFTRLKAAGLLRPPRKRVVRSYLGLACSQYGFTVLDEFEQLLSNCKLKGLPDSL